MIAQFIEKVGTALPTLLIALPILGAANVVGGALLGELEHEFKLSLFFEGIKKVATVYFMILLIVVAGALVDVQLFVVNGDAVNLIDAVTVGVFAAVGLYGFKSVEKLYQILKVNIDLKEKE